MVCSSPSRLLLEKGVDGAAHCTGVVLELDGDEGPRATRAATLAQRLCDASDRAFLGARPYRRGAAFLRGTA